MLLEKTHQWQQSQPKQVGKPKSAVFINIVMNPINLLFICASTDAMAIMLKYCQSCGDEDEDMFEFVHNITRWKRDVALLRTNTIADPTHVFLKDFMKNVKFVSNGQRKNHNNRSNMNNVNNTINNIRNNNSRNNNMRNNNIRNNNTSNNNTSNNNHGTIGIASKAYNGSRQSKASNGSNSKNSNINNFNNKNNINSKICSINGNNNKNTASNNNNTRNRKNLNGSSVFVYLFKHQSLLRRDGFPLNKCNNMVVNEMELICDNLIQWGNKKFNKPVIALYNHALKLFDPKNLENKTVLELHSLVNEQMDPMCQILNDGEWGVFNNDILKKEFKRWAGIANQTLKSKEWKNIVNKNAESYSKHVSTRIRLFWKYFIEADGNDMDFPYLIKLARSLIKRKTTIFAVERFHKRRRDTRGNKNRRRMLLSTEQKNSEIYVNLPKVLKEDTLLNIAVAEKRSMLERKALRISKAKETNENKKQIAKEIAPLFDSNSNCNEECEKNDSDIVVSGKDEFV